MEDPAAPLPCRSRPPPCGDPDDVSRADASPTGWAARSTAELDFRDNGGVHTNSGIANKAAYLLGEPGSHSFNGGR